MATYTWRLVSGILDLETEKEATCYTAMQRSNPRLSAAPAAAPDPADVLQKLFDTVRDPGKARDAKYYTDLERT
jgi:hypothetical protein